ncbi:hypothetical protein TL08_04595 [Actinoalloteichus hymeniacidonis]|uniref:Uncharacterized protein n=2 Tax=Actinoalloteichus hymeniacidonis TaxID=340345 RepID=A0AAC9HM96_9PSEU|nr:hypothetical protein TL08_04595 [Actinoalloteichus hymeniacidonis]
MDIESDGSEIPHTRYEGYSLQEKFDWLRGGSGSAAAEQVRAALSRLAAAMAESDQALRAALRPLGADWQGSAADSLSATGTATSAWVLAGGDAVQLGSSTADTAGAGFVTARLLVEQPDSAGGQGNDATVDVFLGPWGGHTDLTVAAEIERGREDAANRSLYAYEDTLREAVRTLPPLGPPPGLAITVTGPNGGDAASSVVRQSGSATETAVGVAVEAGQSTTGVFAHPAVDGLSELGPQTVRVSALGIEVAVDVDPQALADSTPSAEEPSAAAPPVAAPQQPETVPPAVPSSGPDVETAGTGVAAPSPQPPAQPHTGAVSNIGAGGSGVGVVGAPAYRIDAYAPIRSAEGPLVWDGRRRITGAVSEAPGQLRGIDAPDDAHRSWVGPTIDRAGGTAVVGSTASESEGSTALSPTTATGWDSSGLAAIGGVPYATGEAGGWSGRRRTQRIEDDGDRPIDVTNSRFEPVLDPPIAEAGAESGSATRTRGSGRDSVDGRPRASGTQDADLLDPALAPSGVHTVAPAVFGVDASGASV